VLQSTKKDATKLQILKGVLMKTILMILISAFISTQGFSADLNEFTSQLEQTMGIKLTEKGVQLNGPNCRIQASVEIDHFGKRAPRFGLQTHNPQSWEVKGWYFYLGLGSPACDFKEVSAGGERVISALCTVEECETQGCVTATYSLAVSKAGVQIGDSPVCRYR
jgi:hypothetical protein